MTPSHHPDAATLMSFTAGSLSSALAAAILGHVALCAVCRRDMQLMEMIGGAVMRSLPEAAILASAETPRPPPSSVMIEPAPSETRLLRGVPPPLAKLIGDDLDALPWSRLAPGLFRHVIPLPSPTDGLLQLIKAGPGRSIPEHDHHGQELTLVLRGSYSDAYGEFGPGDIADLDEAVDHLPIANAELGCICLVASEKPPAFRGFIPRLVQSLRK